MEFPEIKISLDFELFQRNTCGAVFRFQEIPKMHKFFQRLRRKGEMQERVHDDFREFLESKCDAHLNFIKSSKTI